MPRVTLASVGQIDSFLDKIRLLEREGYISEVNITIAELMLEDFAGFSDKAFKAFYARKILQIPPVIAAQVFYVSNGLISQAAGDRNVYTVRNAEGMDDDLARGLFMIPNVPGRHGNMLSRQARANIFRNLARMAVIKNRGVDIPRFQNRMVAGYMSDMAADELRDNILPRFARNIREQMGSAQASATPEAGTASTESVTYGRTNTVPLTSPQVGSAVVTLVAAGANRESAERTVQGLLDLGFNITFPNRTGNELTVRLFYYGQMSNAVPVSAVSRMIRGGLGLRERDVSIGVRGDDLGGRIIIPNGGAAAAQPESTDSTTTMGEVTSTSNNRRNIFTDPILASRTINWFRNNGYEDTYDRFFYLVSNTSSAMITVQDESPQRLKITVATSDGTEIAAGEMKAALAGPRFGGERGNANQLRRFGQISYSAPTEEALRTSVTWIILPFTSEVSSSTASTEPTATTPTVAGAREIGQEYMDLSPRVQSSIDADDYLKFREAGYSKRDVQALVDFIGRYGLKIVTIINRSAVGQMPPNLRISVVGRNSLARSFRNGTFLNFLRARMNSIGRTDAEVQVLAPGGRPYQSATFRGTGRGQTPRGTLIIPMGNQQTQTAASAPETAASQPMTPTGGRNTQIVYLGNVQGQANRIYRAGELRFFTNGIFGSLGLADYSAIAFFYDPSQGSMPGSILTAPLGTIERDAGQNFSDVMNYLADNGRFENPGKLKAYFVRENAVQVAKGILNTNSFTPVRPSGAAKEITVDRVRLYTINEFAQWASTEPMLSVFRAIGNVSSTIPSSPSSSTVTEEQAAQVSQMSFTNTLGFEFEGGGSQGRRETATALTRMGVPCNFEGYNHTTRAQWKIVTDATLGGVQNGMELVSPILTGEEGLKDLAKCLRASQEAGMFIHEQGGVHLHMGNQQWDLQHRKNILLNQVKVQKFFLKTIPQYRENQAQQWARPFNTSSSFTDRVRNANSTQQLARVTGTRYMLINITNTRQPTWEWRYPTGSLEVDTNIYSARMIDKLVQVSKFGELPSNMTSGEGLKKWMSQDIFNFWKNRIYELSQTKGSTRRPSSN